MQIEDQTKQHTHTHTQHSHIDTCDTIHKDGKKCGGGKRKQTTERKTHKFSVSLREEKKYDKKRDVQTASKNKRAPHTHTKRKNA